MHHTTFVPCIHIDAFFLTRAMDLLPWTVLGFSVDIVWSRGCVFYVSLEPTYSDGFSLEGFKTINGTRHRVNFADLRDDDPFASNGTSRHRSTLCLTTQY